MYKGEIMSVINSDKLRVEIDEVGSSLLSIKDSDGREHLWQGDEASWTGRDVTIFPFVGRLKDGYYTVGGEKYNMPAHGICREHKFAVADKSQERVVHSFEWDEETFKVYPFKFVLTVEHKVEGARYVKTMTVKNVDSKDIYFSLGGHPAMSVVQESGDTAVNEIVFDGEISPNVYLLDEVGHFIEKKQSFGRLEKIKCDKATMKELKTIILTDGVFESLQLKRPDGVVYKFDLGKPPVLAFWSHEDSGAYYCVEPWWGIPDFADPIRELKDKAHIEKLKVGQSQSYSFSIEIK